MLVYLGCGARHYGTSPLRVMRRSLWEFQAVVEGQIAPLLENTEVPLREHRLWVFPPNHPHGWRGDPERAAEVAVFHFPAVDPVIRESFPCSGYLEIPLVPRDCARLIDLAQRAAAEFTRPNRLTLLRQEHLRLELCLMAADRIAAAPAGALRNRANTVVEKAILWFEQNLAENPGLETVGRAVGASPAHLRRLFHESLGCSPSEVFRRIQFDRAIKAMSETVECFESIADSCGFGSASAFSRAFKKRMGFAPRDWRRGLANPRPVGRGE